MNSVNKILESLRSELEDTQCVTENDELEINNDTTDESHDSDDCLEEGVGKLTPGTVTFYGGRVKPGTDTPPMYGSNKAIDVSVDHDHDGFFVVVYDTDEDVEYEISKTGIKSYEEAVALGNKLLKDWTNPDFDARKMAKKFGMYYNG